MKVFLVVVCLFVCLFVCFSEYCGLHLYDFFVPVDSSKPFTQLVPFTLARTEGAAVEDASTLKPCIMVTSAEEELKPLPSALSVSSGVSYRLLPGPDGARRPALLSAQHQGLLRGRLRLLRLHVLQPRAGTQLCGVSAGGKKKNRFHFVRREKAVG